MLNRNPSLVKYEMLNTDASSPGEKIRISIPRALWQNVPTVPLPTASPAPSPFDRHFSFNIEDLSPLILARLNPEYDRIATLLANRLVKVSSGTPISRQDILANTADVMRKVGIREGWSEAGHRESDTAPDADMAEEDIAPGFTEDMVKGFEDGDTSYRDWENETNATNSLPAPISSKSTIRESPGIDKDTLNVERARRDSSTSASHIHIQFSNNDIDPSDFSNHDIDPSDIKTPEIPAQTRHRSPDQEDSTFDGIETPRSSPLLARRPRPHHHRSQSSSLHITQTPPGAPKRARRDMSEPVSGPVRLVDFHVLIPVARHALPSRYTIKHGRITTIQPIPHCSSTSTPYTITAIDIYRRCWTISRSIRRIARYHIRQITSFAIL
jgi:hypothetical protein